MMDDACNGKCQHLCTSIWLADILTSNKTIILIFRWKDD